MEYNTERNKMIASEYGRNFQKIINHISTIEDRAKRTMMAEKIIDIMASVHTDIKSQENYKQVLYDLIYSMSDNKLDIDSKYPLPSFENKNKKPEKLNYSDANIKLKPYGKYIQKIIKEAVALEDGQEKEELVKVIANNLKRMYLNWNRDSVNDELIYEHLDLLSDGQLKLRESDRLKTTSEILKTSVQSKNATSKKGGSNSNKKRIKKNKENFYKKRSK